MMKRVPFNPSQEQIWMNEKAFPGEAVNTIGIRLYVPGFGADALGRAADQVIDACGLFYVTADPEGEELLWLQDEEAAGRRWDEEAVTPAPCCRERLRYCRRMPETWRKDAEELCENAESAPLPAGVLYEASVFPIREGGALLSFLFHHILVDGYSMCRIAQMILDGLDGKKPPKVPGEREQGTMEETARQMDREFWREYLKGLQAENRILPGEPKSLGRFRLRYSFPLSFSREIDAYAAALGVTPAAVFSAAFSLYLARAGRTADAVFVMPRLNRDTEKERRELGCRTLAVPVRVTVEETMDFAGLCRKAREQANKASAHKQYGLGQILRDLREEGQIGETLSQYTLNIYQPRLRAAFPFSIQLSMDGAMHNHLTANITRLSDSYEICYDCREGVYTREKAEDFHRAFLEILEQGIRSGGPVSEFSIVGAPERERLLHMEGKSVPVSGGDTIPSLFSRAVKSWPDRPALYAGKWALTFLELERVSNRAANALLARGVKPGEPVLFMLRRDWRVLPVMLGILKAGAAFVPVDPRYPKNRVDYMLENSGAALLISSGDVEAAAGREYLEADQLLDFPEETRPEVLIPQEQMAYCIYTSGTTGTPKGVMVSHRGIVNITHPDNNPFNRDICRCGRGIVAVGSVCFDISLFEMFVPLFNGMFVEFAPEEALADPVKIAGLLTAHKANLLHCTPSRLAACLKEPRFAAALENVEAILAAGEVLPGGLVDELKKRYGIRIYNGYGPTETTIGVSITEAGDNQTIGRPIANTGVMILDEKGRLLPLGAVGEICVYGKGVGLGYLGLPEQTRERFVVRFGRRMYRTGDLGAFLEDGRILYRGRSDHQVKLRGLRIEPGEIENQMCAFPGVGEAHVLVRILSGSEHLAGFYTVNAGERVDPDALRTHLKGQLAPYMVPDIFRELSSFPQTPAGKTDLRALEQEPVEYVRIYRAPQTELEKKLCSAFSAVLGGEPAGLEDNFFELGGDSLHIAELVCAVEERLPGLALSFEDIFRYPTPELLARHLAGSSEGGQEEDHENGALKDLDYGEIHRLLSKDRSGKPSAHSMGNLLLTGATGFLGIHLLLELLEQPDQGEKIFCLVRPTKRLTAEKRLRSALFYYGENDYSSLFGKRLFVVEGDLEQDGGWSVALRGQGIRTVINCAANVAHFACDDKLERINVGGVKNLLAFCREQQAALVQISTISVAGRCPAGKVRQTLTEQKLYIGQEIKNQYILSKYMAEYEVLQAAVREKIPVKIMRVGNLQGRLSDGEFQMNSRTNGFTRRLAVYVKLGKAPRSLYEGTVNFSPVDQVARRIRLLCGLSGPCMVFHVCPPDIPYARLFAAAGRMGRPVKPLEDSVFEQYLETLGRTREGKLLLESILLEEAGGHGQENFVAADWTGGILSRLGEEWEAVTDDYLNRYVSVLEDYRLFEEEI